MYRVDVSAWVSCDWVLVKEKVEFGGCFRRESAGNSCCWEECSTSSLGICRIIVLGVVVSVNMREFAARESAGPPYQVYFFYFVCPEALVGVGRWGVSSQGVDYCHVVIRDADSPGHRFKTAAVCPALRDGRELSLE